MPTRYVIAFMIFLNTFYMIMIRANISINLVAMVPVNTNITSNVDTGIYWSASQRALVLSSYFWGCLAGNFIAGPLLERWSVRKTMFFCLLIIGILNILGPMASKLGYETLIVTRILIGIFSGFINPGNSKLISKWSTSHEKGLFVGSSVLGSSGTFFAWSIGGYIVENYGWTWGFYIFGVGGPLIAVVWWLTVYDTPEVHPRILAKERKYLENENALKQGIKDTPPFRSIYTSVPVWSLVVLNFGLGWGINFIVTAAPNYIANALGYSITITGMMSAIIYLFRSLVAFFAGGISDVLLKKGIISFNLLRKGGVFLSHILPGCILLCMMKTGLPAMVYVVILGISMAFNGLVTLSSSVNCHDLTANYVSTVAGLVFSAVTGAGIVTPLVTGYITKDDETNVEVWRTVYLVGATVYLISGLQFYLFGSIDKQPWDKSQSQKEKESNGVAIQKC